MTSYENPTRLDRLLSLAHSLGHPDLAILAEGNVSTRDVAPGDPGILVKASGHSLASLTTFDLVRCRPQPLLGLLDHPETPDDQIDQSLLDSRHDPAAPRPSVESVFHAFLLSLPGIEWVGHTHPVAVNRILCSPRAAEFAARRLFPDEVVCCGEESVLVPYVDPGLPLAAAIRRETESFILRRAQPPRVILLASHGLVAVGPTENAVLAATLMAVKAAEIWLGAAALGGPSFLSPGDVHRIANRADEHYRRRVLNL